MSTLVLSAPDCFGGIVTVFHQGMDKALFFYATNPRTAYALVFAILFLIYYLREVVKKPDFYARDGKFRWFLLANCCQLQERFWPTFWCFGTHAQTCLANCIRNTLPHLKYTREYISLPDGGQVSLDWYDAPKMSLNWRGHRRDDDRRPIALFIPGLTGDSQTEYIKSLIPHSQALGYRAVGFNNRGRGGMKLLTPKLYCAANCDDVKFVLEHMKSKYPKAQIVATGVSLGGILLCRYLIMAGERSLVDAAMLISVCWDFIAGSASMAKPGLNMALNQHLARSLVSVVIEAKEMLETLSQINYAEVIESRTLIEFDERFTCKMWGYKCVSDYHVESSNKGKLACIKVPTFCVNAADDMFAPLHALPLSEVQESSHVTMVVTQKGGHIGFMEGLLPTLPFYSERLSHQFLSALAKLVNIRKELS